MREGRTSDDSTMLQDRQHMYEVTLRRVRVTIDVVEKQ